MRSNFQFSLFSFQFLKNPLAVFGGDAGDIFKGQVAHFGHFGGDERDVHAFVAGTSVRGGGKEGGVGLEHDMFGSHGLYDLLQFVVFEGDHAADAQGKAMSDSPFSLLDSTREAVEHATPLHVAKLVEDGERIFVAAADVDRERHVAFACPSELGVEHLLLLAP